MATASRKSSEHLLTTEDVPISNPEQQSRQASGHMSQHSKLEQQSRQASGHISQHSITGSVTENVQSKQESKRESRRGTAGVSTAGTVTRPPTDFEADDGTCSMVIICEGRKLYCHKDFLCIWSPVMKEKCYPDQSSVANKEAEQLKEDIEANAEIIREPTINTDGLVEIEMEESNYEEMKEFLRCLYPPHKEVTEENVDEVVALASEYKTEQLKNKCEEVLLSREATVELMLTAETFELTKLKEDVAKRLASKQLQSVEEDPAFEELGGESKMMIWREMAFNLESQQDEIDDLYDSINKTIKVLIKGHKPCKSVKDQSAFGNVPISTRDPKGKKKKEVIQNAVQLKIDEFDEKCKECMIQLGRVAKTQIQDIDNRKKFEKMKQKERERHDEHFCHGYFKYKPGFYSAFG